MKKKIPEIDLARGISIFFIVFFHYFLEVSHFSIRPVVGTLSQNLSRHFILPWGVNLSLLLNPLSALFSFGWEFVGVFIFLSGFTLYYSQKNAPTLPPSFLVKRILSLVPAWQLAIIFAFLVNLFSAHFFSHFLASNQSTKLSDYLYLLLYPIVIDFTFQHIPAVNPSLWFMSLLFQFYLIFEIIYLFIQKIGLKKVLISSIIIGVISRIILVYLLNGIPTALSISIPKNYQAFTLFPARIIEFIAGMYFADLYIHKASFNFLRSKTILITSFILWLIGNLCNYFVFGWIFSDTFITLGLVGLLFNMIFLLRSPHLRKFLAILGKKSIWIYLFHNELLTQIIVPLTFILSQKIPLPLSILCALLTILGTLVLVSWLLKTDISKNTARRPYLSV